MLEIATVAVQAGPSAFETIQIIIQSVRAPNETARSGFLICPAHNRSEVCPDRPTRLAEIPPRDTPELARVKGMSFQPQMRCASS